MIEALHQSEAQTPAGDDGSVSAGALLRHAREAAGLHVAALAVSLKVPVRKLEALEDDQYQQLSDAVFVRGLASSVCRTLKIDPQPVLDRLPQTTAPRLPQDGDGLNAPFRAPTDGAPPGWIDYVRQPVFLAVFALLLGALVLILLPTARKDDKPLQPVAASAPAAVATATETVAAPQPVPQPAVLAAPTEQVPPTAVPDPSQKAAAVLPVAVAAPSSVPPTTAPTFAAAPTPKSSASSAAPAASAAAAPEATPATGLVVIRAKGDTWVEVTDAKGVAVLRRLVTAGESVGTSGALPLRVTIGRAHLTDVLVRGKPFDMRPVSRDDVARFEVK